MAKITVTLTAQYDDGKAVKEPGDTISLDEKLASQLADLGMVEWPVKEVKTPKGKKGKTEEAPGVDDDDAAPGIPDPDALGSDEE